MLQLTEVDDPGQWRRNLGRGRQRRAMASIEFHGEELQGRKVRERRKRSQTRHVGWVDYFKVF
jgi:hypothetical protein